MAKKKSPEQHPATLVEAVRYFSNIDRCTEILAQTRWPNGVHCPRCGSENVGYIATRRLWECRTKHPKKQFSVKVGTIFEDSPIGLDKWFVAVWLIANDKNGISSYEIHRALGITQKSAWFMMHRIRFAMQRGTFDTPLYGEVEIDETFIGGKARNMKAGKWKEKGRTGVRGKQVVMGLLQRHGEVRVAHISDTQRETLNEQVHANVLPGAHVFTDEWAGYNALDQRYLHQVINHAESYVRGNVHTNGMENFWALLKRGLHGTYVSVEPFHLFRYLDEQAFRFNERHGSDADRFAETLMGVDGRRLTYKKLIGEGKPSTPASA